MKSGPVSSTSSHELITQRLAASAARSDMIANEAPAVRRPGTITVLWKIVRQRDRPGDDDDVRDDVERASGEHEERQPCRIRVRCNPDERRRERRRCRGKRIHREVEADARDAAPRDCKADGGAGRCQRNRVPPPEEDGDCDDEDIPRSRSRCCRPRSSEPAAAPQRARARRRGALRARRSSRAAPRRSRRARSRRAAQRPRSRLTDVEREPFGESEERLGHGGGK